MKNKNNGMTCPRCITDSTIPGFAMGPSQCVYCDLHDALNEAYPINEAHFISEVQQIRAERENPLDYDGIVGVSGGCDSSYLLHKLRTQGLRVVAVNYDNGWDTKVARDNIMKLCKVLGVPLAITKTEPGDAESVWLSFLKSGVTDVEAPTDIALTRVLYDAARKYKVKYIFDGHSFRTEGVAPIGLSYMDGRYIADVWKHYGKGGPYPLPNLTIGRWISDMVLKGFKRPRLLYSLPYDKNKAKATMIAKYGWEDYGMHHAENEFTTWFGYVYRPQRVKVDGRKVSLSAFVREGTMTRDAALKVVSEPPAIPPYATTEYIAERLGIKLHMLQQYMRAPIADRNEYESYRATFKRLKPLFWALHKAGRVPTTFYKKYVE